MKKIKINISTDFSSVKKVFRNSNINVEVTIVKKKGILLGLITACTIFLAGCGKPDYSGYYIYDSGNGVYEVNVAMTIDKHGNVL